VVLGRKGDQENLDRHLELLPAQNSFNEETYQGTDSSVPYMSQNELGLQIMISENVDRHGMEQAFRPALKAKMWIATGWSRPLGLR